MNAEQVRSLRDYFGDLQYDTFVVAREHGFWLHAWQYGQYNNSILYEKLALVHSELGEATEELRKLTPNPTGEDGIPGPEYVYYRDDGKPEGFGMELADAVIRIMDIAAHCGIPLIDNILEKHEYNKTRPYMHGKSA